MVDKLNQYGNFASKTLVWFFSYSVRFSKDISAVVVNLS